MNKGNDIQNSVEEQQPPPSYYDATAKHNVQPSNVAELPPPVYTATPTSAMKENYIASPVGFVNLLLILFLMASWISIAAVPKAKYLPLLSRSAAEEAFLFFAIVGFIIEIIVLVLHLSELSAKLRSVPLNTVLAVKDLILAMPIFALSITAAVYESRQRLASGVYANYFSVYNKGAFGSAAFFGFAVVILYMIHCVFSSKQAKKELRQQQP